MAIDPDSKLPLYYQLKEELSRMILDGTLKEGSLIPPERELSERYHLSSTTVRRALNDLVHESLLERKAGKGSFVRARPVQRDLRKVLSFTNNMKEMGLLPSAKVLNQRVVTPNEFACEHLNLSKGAKVVKLERLRLASGVPMTLETRFIRMDLCPGIVDLDLSSSLWNIFEHRYGRKPYKHSQSVRIVRICGKHASLLDVEENSPVYLIRGITYLHDGQAIECDESFYRGDKYEITFEAIAE